jgi:hypothetical protein
MRWSELSDDLSLWSLPASRTKNGLPLAEHRVATLVGQRVLGIALGYEDLVDHDKLGHDPATTVLIGNLEAQRSDGARAAGKSTLNRLELSRGEPTCHQNRARRRGD